MAKIKNRNKLVYFNYPRVATKANQLPTFDRLPLCVVLDITATTLLCINTHHIPRTAAKSRLIAWLLDNSRRLKSRIIPLLYGVVKADPRLQGSLPGIRRYRKSRIRGNMSALSVGFARAPRLITPLAVELSIAAS